MQRRLAVGIRNSLLIVGGLLLGGGMAVAQEQGPPPAQVVGPQRPVLQRRPVEAPPAPPFVLTPQEQAEVDAVLAAWERVGKEVRTFQCPFTRLEYDATFPGKVNKATNPNGAKWIDHGTIKYAAPDKGRFELEGYLPDDPKTTRQEKWVCDGKSVFVYDWGKPELDEFPLPAQLRGKAIVDGPLPFLFGADAQKLKQRYYIRLMTPPDIEGQVWLDAYPRFLADARNLQRAQLILKTRGMIPVAMQIYLPGGNNRQVYNFGNAVINDSDFLRNFLEGDPFAAPTPLLWKKVVNPPEGPPAQAGRLPAAAR
jgi:TIGR03009 family protein